MQPLATINRNSRVKTSNLFLNYLVCLVVAYVAALFLFNTVWVRLTAEVHTLLELIDIVILFSTFFVVFLTYNKNTSINQIIALGFLAVGVIDMFHTYYYPALRHSPEGYSDLSIRYWIIRRAIEVFVIFMTTSKIKTVRFNKWFWFFSIVLLSFSLCHILIAANYSLPLLMSKKGLTPIGVYLELIIIAISVITLDRICGRLEGKHTITYSYLWVAVMLFITVELSSLLVRGPYSFFSAFTHVLKLAYCIYIFKAIFLSAVTFPYEKLEETKKELEDVNVQLQNSISKINRMREDNDRILNALPIGILCFSRENISNFANEQASELLGCSSHDLIGFSQEHMVERFCSTDRSYKTICEALREYGEIHNMVNTYKKDDGEEIILSISGFRTDDRIILMLKDAAKEQELEKLQIQTQTILNAINSGIIITDNEDNILMCNKACEGISDMGCEQIMAMGKGFISKMFAGAEPNSSNLNGPEEMKWRETSFITMKGNKKHILGSASIVYNLVGEEIGKILIASDITELKKQENIIMQQEKLAIIGQMAAGIVHEIKNPLAAIKGFSQITKAKIKDETLGKYLDTISQAVNDINKVVVDFLDFAKPKQGKNDIVSVNKVIQSLQLIVETQCYSKNISSHFNYCTENADVWADETKIKQVVLNICENAIDAMSDVDKPRLEVFTEYSEAEGMVLIRVHDNGKGIPPEDITRIGTSFYTTKEKGTGLGMNICFRIVNEMNGKIEIESRLGYGSEFTVKLPLKR